MNMNLSKEALQQMLVSTLKIRFGCTPQEATDRQMYGAELTTVQQILLGKRADYQDTLRKEQPKRIYYMSMEFLVGRSLRNNLYNLELEAQMKDSLSELGFNLDTICEMEPDAGLGNGGLGRLASCYMDAATTMGYPITGFSIR